MKRAQSCFSGKQFRAISSARCRSWITQQMYKHTLIATDGSELAERAVAAVLGLAKGLGAKATAVTVSEPWAAARTCHGSVGVPFDAYENAAAGDAAKALA